VRPRAAVSIAVALATLIVAGCGGGGAQRAAPTTNDIPGAALFAYDAGRPTDVRAAADGQDVPGLRVERGTFAGPDGRKRIPAAFARPVDGAVRGCLVYEGGIGSTLADAPRMWQAAGSLGLATLTIGLPWSDEGPTPDIELDRALRDPVAFATMLRDTVLDLRRALDVLRGRAECRDQKIGYLGVSYGGFAGALLAGVDLRIDAAALLVTGADWPTLVHAPGAVAHFPDPTAAVRILAPYDPGRWVRWIAPRPLLLINGRRDETVPLAAARALAGSAGAPKTIVRYDGGHDPFAGPWSKRVAAAVARFLRANVAAR